MDSPAAMELLQENEELRRQLEEAQQVLDAIRSGEVDSLVVESPSGPRVFALEGATQSYRALVEAMNEGAATLTADGTLVYCNACLARMLEMPLEQVMGRPVADFLAADSLLTWAALLAGAGSGSKGELSLLSRGGRVVPVYLSLSALVEGGQRVLCMVVTDLSEQKRNEEIVAAERLARSVLEQAAEAVVVCDGQGNVIRASVSAHQLCGLNPLQRPFDEAIAISLEVPLGTPLAAAALRGEVLRTAPGTLNRADGTHVAVLASATPLRGADQAVVGCVISLVDITARKRAEQELRDADRHKTEFIGVLSHELRNPLAPIRNAVYILNRVAQLDDAGKRAAAIIGRQVDHMVRLVDDLLDVTRISRGKVLLKRSRVELGALVRRTLQDLASVLEAHVTHVDVPAEEAWVDGDPTRLAQMLGNLLQNAAKFTPAGGRVWVSLSQAGGVAHLEVADNGVGIEPAVLEKLFQPFVQSDRSLERSRGGLGLGLALVKGLVELHGGSVRAVSAGPGCGARFILDIPLVSAAPSAQPGGLPAGAARATGRKVLVIEDNVDAATSLRDVLAMLGHQVEVAHSGPDGVSAARTFHPDVVVCDIGLPEMDGYAVARAVRADPALADARLVALSGYAQPEDLAQAREAGFSAHLAKPPDLPALLRLLTEAPATSRAT